MSVIQLATRAEFMNRRTKAKSIPFYFTLQFLSLNFLSYRFHLSCLAFCVSEFSFNFTCCGWRHNYASHYHRHSKA